jgi:hypothetical protein
MLDKIGWLLMDAEADSTVFLAMVLPVCMV